MGSLSGESGQLATCLSSLDLRLFSLGFHGPHCRRRRGLLHAPQTDPMANERSWKLLAGYGFIVVLACTGCGKQEQISRYTVAKPEPIVERDPHEGLGIKPPSGEPTDRTLGAVVPRGEQGWFFKVTGPKDAVEAQVGAVTDFLKTVRFTTEAKPEWNLPEGWQQRAGNDIRFATLVIPAAPKPLELSVTVLPKSGDDGPYILMNVNRWRNQLGLPPVAAEELADGSTQVAVGDATATIVNLLGASSGGSMGRPPFMSGERNGK